MRSSWRLATPIVQAVVITTKLRPAGLASLLSVNDQGQVAGIMLATNSVQYSTGASTEWERSRDNPRVMTWLPYRHRRTERRTVQRLDLCDTWQPSIRSHHSLNQRQRSGLEQRFPASIRRERGTPRSLLDSCWC